MFQFSVWFPEMILSLEQASVDAYFSYLEIMALTGEKSSEMLYVKSTAKGNTLNTITITTGF